MVVNYLDLEVICDHNVMLPKLADTPRHTPRAISLHSQSSDMLVTFGQDCMGSRKSNWEDLDALGQRSSYINQLFFM